MKLPIVSFIDDGINPAIVPGDIDFINLVITNNEVSLNDKCDYYAHASECFNIFQKHVRVPYVLVSIKVMDKEIQKGHTQDLLLALEWCEKNDVSIINLSIGSSYFGDMNSLYNAVHRLHSKNVIVVAACNNNNTLTYPASFPHVIGTRHYNNKSLKGIIGFLEYSLDGIEFMTYAESCTNSHAAPLVTAKICNYLYKRPFTPEEAHTYLYKNALKFNFCDKNRPIDFYKSILNDWTIIDVPIVLFVKDNPEMSANAFSKNLEELITLLRIDGYHAIGLSQFITIDFSNVILKIPEQSKISSLYEAIVIMFNLMQPDIIFIDVSKKDAKWLQEQNIEDVELARTKICSPQNVQKLLKEILS